MQQLLQRLATRQRQALDISRRAQLRDHAGDIALGPITVRRRVEAARAAERAALEPHHEPSAWPVGTAARLDGVELHLAVT